jgi:hypothetical protein
MNNTTEKTYRGWPARLVIINTDGRIAFMTPSSPNGANPDPAPRVLDRLLSRNAPTSQPTR